MCVVLALPFTIKHGSSVIIVCNPTIIELPKTVKFPFIVAFWHTVKSFVVTSLHLYIKLPSSNSSLMSGIKSPSTLIVPFSCASIKSVTIFTLAVTLSAVTILSFNNTPSTTTPWFVVFSKMLSTWIVGAQTTLESTTLAVNVSVMSASLHTTKSLV